MLDQAIVWWSHYWEIIKDNAIWLIILEWIIHKILDILPPQISYKIRFYMKIIWKRIRNKPINILYVLKITDININLDNYEEVIKSHMDNHIYKGQNNSELHFTGRYGRIEPNIMFTYGLSDNYEEEIYINSLQIDMTVKTGFANFKDDLYDLDKFKQELNNELKGLNEVRGESLTCYLKGVYKLTGIPSEVDIKSLSGRLGSNRIEFYYNRVIVYGTILSKQIIELEKIISYYY